MINLPEPALTEGQDMYRWASDLFPICRSLTGPGVRETLSYIQSVLPDLQTFEVPSGTPVMDWTVPDEWTIREAWIEGPDGQRVVDFKNHNLHVVGYSEPVDQVLALDDLQAHLHSLPDQPDAIPYVTSYYSRTWGFCLTDSDRRALPEGDYRVYIDSNLEPGHLSYGELILPGREDREILISTYVCHPSMANNELSGPVVTMALARWLMALPDRRFTYRIVFIPETIGSLTYLSANLERMKEKTVAGYVVTCVGDDRAVSFVETPTGATLADRLTRRVLKQEAPDFISYPFHQGGSDEQQYCSPGVELPVVSIPRTKYGIYPEYHTSLDDLTVISPEGLGGAFHLHQKVIEALEASRCPVMTTKGAPQLGRRGLYPTMSKLGSWKKAEALLALTRYANGQWDIVDIAEETGLALADVEQAMDQLLDAGLVEVSGA